VLSGQQKRRRKPSQAESVTGCLLAATCAPPTSHAPPVLCDRTRPWGSYLESQASGNPTLFARPVDDGATASGLQGRDPSAFGTGPARAGPAFGAASGFGSASGRIVGLSVQVRPGASGSICGLIWVSPSVRSIRAEAWVQVWVDCRPVRTEVASGSPPRTTRTGTCNAGRWCLLRKSPAARHVTTASQAELSDKVRAAHQSRRTMLTVSLHRY
jgi:hypothetical protein